jgi:phage-related protein
MRYDLSKQTGFSAKSDRLLGAGLWEVRSTLSNNRIARLVFFVAEGRIGIVHGFVKKTQKTPPADVALAVKRMKEMMR